MAPPLCCILLYEQTECGGSAIWVYSEKSAFQILFYVDIIDFCALWVYTEKISF